VFSSLKKVVAILIVAVAGTVTFSVTSIGEGDNDIEQPNYIESMKLSSSRYTLPDDLSLVDEDLIISIRSSDELIAENEKLRLYFDDSIVSFKIENKSNGYVFATHIPNVSAGTYDGLLSGGIGLEYITVTKSMNIRQNIGIVDTGFTVEQEPIDNGVHLSLYFGGFCSTRNCKRLYPLYLEGRYTLEQMIEFGFSEINIGFDLIVTLEEDGIRAEVPFNSIVEDAPDEYLLSSVILFPGLGATKLDEIPGYMVIPDGVGALVRYEDNFGRFKAPYESRIYGLNYGLMSLSQTVSNYPLSMPIFGMVHGVNQNGLVGIIENGDYNARLLMFQNGAHNLDYNLIFPKFDIRQTYRQSFTSDGSGGAIRNILSSTADIEVLYKVLDGDDANYVGIANKYRNYLEDNGILNTQVSKDDIPLFLTYLMADSKKAFIGTKTEVMTTVDELTIMHKYFVESGLNSFEVALMGYNKGGYSGQLPSSINFDRSIGNKFAFKDAIDYLQETGNVSLLNNYVFAGEQADGVTSRRDIAKGINRFLLSYECEECVYTNRSLLYPETSLRIGLSHLEDYQDLGVDVTFEGLGRNLFSYFNRDFYHREDAIRYYLELMEAYDGMANFVYPNAYAYKYTNAFLGMPLYNSQLKYFDDLVPLLPIVLVGKIPLYSDYLNFNSFGREQLLTLIDFGIYPSYIMTKNESSLLKDTDIEYIFTSQFDLWKDTVVEEYNDINNALKEVIGYGIKSREVLQLGLVKVTYDNNVSIYINYTTSDKTVEGITVLALDYLVRGEQ